MTKKKEKEEKIMRRLFEISAKVIILKDSEVLILKRTGDEIRDAGKSDLPGGAVEAGEEINDSLLREIKEELGITVEIGPVVYLSNYKKEYFLDEEKKEKVEIFGKGVGLLAYYKEGSIKLSDEHEKYEWLNIEKAIEVFNKDDKFESGKREALIKAKEYLELKNSLDGWKRCQADFENYKKRQAEAQKDFIRFSTESIILQLLPVLDNFHASTDHVPVEQKDTPWVVGIMHIQKQLESVLTTYGVTEIETKVGDDFNPEIHEAVKENTEHGTQNTDQKTGSTEQKDKIKKVIQRGYEMDSKIIRAARVIVE